MWSALDVSASGYIERCLLCGDQGRSPWPTREQAQDAAVWHVYQTHPKAWLAVVGDRPPLNPDPRKAA